MTNIHKNCFILLLTSLAFYTNAFAHPEANKGFYLGEANSPRNGTLDNCKDTIEVSHSYLSFKDLYKSDLNLLAYKITNAHLCEKTITFEIANYYKESNYFSIRFNDYNKMFKTYDLLQTEDLIFNLPPESMIGDQRTVFSFDTQVLTAKDYIKFKLAYLECSTIETKLNLQEDNNFISFGCEDFNSLKFKKLRKLL